LDEQALNREGDGDQYRLLRGGSWLNYPGLCRSAYRYSFSPGDRGGLVGFRVCCLPQGCFSLPFNPLNLYS
jgi:formylglycine-generating enzyme required for sulfatase activity